MSSHINTFIDYCRKLEDPRVPGLITYPLEEMLLLSLCGILSGHNDWHDISYWGKHKLLWLREFLPYASGIPTATTLTRVFNSLDSKSFQKIFEHWVSNLGISLSKKHVSIDGKVIRGSKKASDGSGATHIISAFASEINLVIGQETVENKSNEITAIPKLLDKLSLEGSIVSIDAIGTQKDIVNKIRDKKANYVLALKDNQKSLCEDVKSFFDHLDEETTYYEDENTDAGHGRIEVRTCTVTHDVDWLNELHPDWKDLRSIARVHAIRINKKTLKQTEETRYYISSLMTNAKHMQHLVRSHWAIENSLHWCLDVIFKEDDCRVRTLNGPENLATIRKAAINILKCNKEKIPLKRKKIKANLDLEYLKLLIKTSNL